METRKEEGDYLILTGLNGIITASRAGVVIADIRSTWFTATLKSGRTGLDIRNNERIVTGGLWGQIIANGTTITADNWESVIASLIQSAGGGDGDMVSFPDITGNPTENAALNAKFNEYLSLSGGIMSGPIDVGSLTSSKGEIKIDANIDLTDNKKILFNAVLNGVDTELAITFIGEYANIVNPITGEVYARWLQTESGNTHIPFNPSTANNPIYGKYIAYDVGSYWNDPTGYPAMDKQVLATFTEGVLQLPENFFNPVDDGSGKLVIEGVTLADLNTLAIKYNAGLHPVAKDPSVLTFRTTRLVITADVAYFDYNFLKVNGEKVQRYVVSVTGTSANVNTLRCELTTWDIGSLPISFYLPYGNGTPANVLISDSGIQLNVNYKDTASCGATISAPNGDITILNAYRTSIYNGVSEGQVLPGQTVTSTPVNVDDTIYASFNDECTIRIMKTGTVYEIKFIVGNGFVIGEYKKINS